jgi:hypothetical protein
MKYFVESAGPRESRYNHFIVILNRYAKITMNQKWTRLPLIGFFGLLLVILAIAIPAHHVMAESDENLEYRVKAAFLYNFMKFVEWPKTEIGKSEKIIRLYVFGTDPFGGALNSLNGKTVGERTIQVAVGEDLSAAASSNVLFISQVRTVPTDEILGKIKTAPVLTVADSEGFCNAGGMINLVIINNKVRFEINQKAVMQSGLKMSSQLLKLAIAVDK